MKKLLFLGACLVALASSPVRAQTGGADVVVVRLSYTGNRILTTIARGAGKTELADEEVPLSTVKNTVQVTAAYQRVLAKLTQEGYLLKGMSGGDTFTTIVFIKGQ